MTAPKETAKERTERLLKGSGSSKAASKAPIESLKKGEEIKKAKKGGARVGAGRKPKIENLIAKGYKQLTDKFAMEDVYVEVTTPDGKKIKVKKPRFLVALEKLYEIGMTKDSHEALEKVLSRIAGKAAQPIRGDEGDDTPIRLEVDINSILDKAYGDNQ